MKKIFFFLAAMALAITANAKVTTISPDAENDALRLAVYYAEDGDIIEMTEGTYVQCNNSYLAFEGKSVTVKAAEGANVVLQLQVPITLTNGGKATLQGIKIDASRLLEKASWYEHVIYTTDATGGKELVMDGCELYGFNLNKSAIYSKADNKLDLCRINNCYFHDVEKSCLFFEGASIAELSVTNSTFANNVAKVTDSYYAGPIDVRNADAKVTIDHCTFYDCKAMSTDYATVTMKGPQAANVVISNNIFALSSDETAMRAIRNNVNAKNCLTFNYKYSSDSNPGLHSTVAPTDCLLNVDPKFVDAANGNFALADGSPALTAGTDGKAIGDPRWNVVAEPEPTTETVYFVNAQGWTGTINAYAWDPANAAWPGAAATKEAEQIGGYDVYSYTAEAGKYANVIFNGTGGQTADLKWTAGKYYVLDGWYTKEEAEAKLATPIVDEVVYFVNNQKWSKVNAYAWDPANAAWPGAAATKEAEQIGGFDVYSYSAAPGTYQKVIFNDGGSNQTADMVWTAGKYIVNNQWYTKEEAEAALAAPVVTVWTMVGDKALFGTDWDLNATANDLVKQEDGSWVLTLTNKTLAAESYEYKAAKDRSWTTTVPGGDNAKLTISKAGQYDVTFTLNAAATSVTAKATYIPAKYNVTVTAENGTVEGAGEYEEGTTATLTATANEGYEFVNWTVGEEVVSTENPYTFTVNADIALVANFELVPVVEPEKPEPTYTDNNLNPYAFGLESKLSADKETLTVTYRLNNSKATSVNVIVYNGEEVIATVPGTTTIGKNTVAIPTTDFPGGVALTWSVEVNGKSVAAPTREEKIYSFFHPSSVDVDNNPENPTFGMLLVNEAMQKVKTSTKPYVSVGFGAGIFAFTPSFDLMPNGELPGYNGGINFTTGRYDDSSATAYAPRRIRISDDGRIFVTSLNTDGNYLWEVNPENMNEWTPIFKGTRNDKAELVDAESNFIAAPNVGFDVKGSGENLQLLMLSSNLNGFGFAFSGYQTHEYNLGTATEWTTTPSKKVFGGKYVISYTSAQVEYDNEGGVWICQNRSAATDAQPSLIHINAAGEEDYKEVLNSRANAGIRFNHDFSKLIIATSGKKATIYAVSKDANGAPVLTSETVVDMSAVGTNLNDFAWDYAGNLYACGNSSEKLAAWAMPYSGTVETPAASQYAFQVEGSGVGEYYEDVITNMTFDLENMVIIGGPSENFQIDVYLVLGEDDGSGEFQLTEESSVAVQGSDAKFIEGIAYEIDAYAPAALVDLVVEWNGNLYQFHLTMSAAPIEATVVVVENAVVEVKKFEIFEGMYEHSLMMTGVWTDAEGLDYPVTVDVPVYYPEATEPYDMMSTVTVGTMTGNWLGFGEGYLTITTVGDVVTATGVVENPGFGIAIDITISGSLSHGPGTGLENATITIKAVKMIQNGQLIVKKGDVLYNVQGQVIK